jgi:hypothetical protein
MIDQVIWLISNTAGTSVNLKMKILSRLYIIESLSRIIFEAIKNKAQVKQVFLGNIIWCLENLTRIAQPNTNQI